jgi:hypothetical protein
MKRLMRCWLYVDAFLFLCIASKNRPHSSTLRNSADLGIWPRRKSERAPAPRTPTSRHTCWGRRVYGRFCQDTAYLNRCLTRRKQLQSLTIAIGQGMFGPTLGPTDTKKRTEIPTRYHIEIRATGRSDAARTAVRALWPQE